LPKNSGSLTSQIVEHLGRAVLRTVWKGNV